VSEKETLKIGEGKPGPGRPKGVPNKVTTKLKDAILIAAEEAGGDEGLVGYLKAQALANPASFLSLMGRVLPLTLGGDPENPIKHEHGAAAELAAIIDAMSERK
jgi:hypothetical protein